MHNPLLYTVTPSVSNLLPQIQEHIGIIFENFLKNFIQYSKSILNSIKFKDFDYI